jgi:uncharacterized repeat protein (TIGR03803 family)
MIMAARQQSMASIFAIKFSTAIIALGWAIAWVATLVVTPAQAQTFSVIHNFAGGEGGSDPEAGLTIDQQGNLYGTTYYGGHSGSTCAGGECCTVFELKRSGQNWLFAPLYLFTGGSEGSNPEAKVVFGPDGSLYGTTAWGGGISCQTDIGFGCGTVFKVHPKPTNCSSVPCLWTDTVLYRFAGGANDGAVPVADVVFDHAGNLYSTTFEGGVYTTNCNYGHDWCGTVFELTPSHGAWTESLLYRFTGGTDGGVPEAGLTLDSAGNLYGTTLTEEPSGGGTVFEMTNSGSGWAENVLYTFVSGGGGGYFPQGDLIFDPAGNLYGTTIYGGSGGGGTVFQLTPSNGGWTFAQVYGLSGFEQNGPTAGVVRDGAGNLYGTAYDLGPNNAGLIFKLTPSNGGWTYTLLHQFEFTDGCIPVGGVVLDAAGNLYGTASGCGANSMGVVWEITP